MDRILFMYEAFISSFRRPPTAGTPFVSRGFQSPAVVYGNVMGEHYCFCHPMTLRYTGGNPHPPGVERVNEAPHTGYGDRTFHDETQRM